MKQLLTLVLKLYHCVVAFLCSLCVLSDFGRAESLVSMGHLFPQSVLAAIAFMGSGTRSGRAWPRVSLRLLFSSMTATACYSQVAGALVLRYRSKLVLYLLSACLLPPSCGASALVGFNGRERGGGHALSPSTPVRAPDFSWPVTSVSASNGCPCPVWQTAGSQFTISPPILSLPFGNNKLHPHGKLHWSKRYGVGTSCGWVCVLGCSQKTSQSLGSFSLLPLHSLQSEHVCASDSHPSLGFSQPFWFSIQRRVLVFLVLDSRAGMPNLRFEPLIPQGVSLSPNHHTPLLFSFLQSQVLIWSLLLPSYLIICGSSFIGLAVDESGRRQWHPNSSTLAWKILWTEEPGRLQSMGSLRVGHDWATSLSLFTFMHWRRKWQPTPVFLPGESQGWGSLVGFRLWGHTESDTTEAT